MPRVGPMPSQVSCCFSRQFLVVSGRWRHWQDHPPGVGRDEFTLLGFGLLPGAMLVIGSARFWVYFDWLKIGIHTSPKMNTSPKKQPFKKEKSSSNHWFAGGVHSPSDDYHLTTLISQKVGGRNAHPKFHPFWEIPNVFRTPFIKDVGVGGFIYSVQYRLYSFSCVNYEDSPSHRGV